MKKFVKTLLSLICVLALACAFVACGEKEQKPKEVELKLGMGASINLGSSKELKVQVDGLVAAVVTDSEGKIVACRVDAIQNKATIKDGQFEVTNLQTKRELGDKYGMGNKGPDNNGDGKVLEWYAQADAFEAWVVGKTGNDIKNAGTQVVNNHNISTDEALLAAGCTIDITAFYDAVVKACADDQATTFKAVPANVKLGLAVNSALDASSKNPEGENAGSVNMYSDFACTAVVDGKIVAALNDAIQPKVSFTAEGVTEAKFVDTKRGLKEGYNMAQHGTDNNNDGKVLEWYVQSKLFSDYCVGKTGAEVGSLPTQDLNDHKVTTDVELLAAGCTMQITPLSAAISKAAANAR